MGSQAYNREHTVTILLRFNKKTDQDILAKMSTVGNKIAYIKRLIRADLESGKSGKPANPEKTVTDVVTAPEGKFVCLTLPDGRKVHFNQAVFYDDNSCDLMIASPKHAISFDVPNDAISPDAAAWIQDAMKDG